MHGFAYVVVATERERQVAHATTNMCSRQILLYPTSSTYKLERIAVVLFHARCYREDVRVEYYVQRIETNLLCQNAVCSFCDGYLAFIGGSLSFLVEAHYDDRCTKPLDVKSPTLELLLPCF